WRAGTPPLSCCCGGDRQRASADGGSVGRDDSGVTVTTRAMPSCAIGVSSGSTSTAMTPSPVRTASALYTQTWTTVSTEPQRESGPKVAPATAIDVLLIWN